MKTAKQILLDAAALIESKGCWTQESTGRTKNGRKVAYNHKRAAAWCAMGAILKVTPDDEQCALPLYEAQDALEDLIGHDITGWNDQPVRKQADVVEVLRVAANKL